MSKGREGGLRLTRWQEGGAEQQRCGGLETARWNGAGLMSWSMADQRWIGGGLSV